MNLTQVSRTAILLLICRAVEAERDPAKFPDPMAIKGLAKLLSLVSTEDREWIQRLKKRYSSFHETEARAGVRRGLTFDILASQFIATHPGCTLINLAAGFDTRYWRIDHENCRYIELDLPEVIALKRECFEDAIEYETIGCSVLDTSWITQITRYGTSNVLLLAEGLFMYLPKPEVIRLVKELSTRLTRSQLIVEMEPESWTKGFLKALSQLNSKLDWDLDVVWVSGIKNVKEVETYSSGIKVISVDKGSFGPIISMAIN